MIDLELALKINWSINNLRMDYRSELVGIYIEAEAENTEDADEEGWGDYTGSDEDNDDGRENRSSD